MEPESAKTHPTPETKLGHKTQQNYNKSNYKMFYKSVIIVIILYIRTENFLILRIKQKIQTT